MSEPFGWAFDRADLPEVFPDLALFDLQLALSDAWRDIDAEIARPGAVGDVAGAVARWRSLYRVWCALTSERAYWGT